MPPPKLNPIIPIPAVPSTGASVAKTPRVFFWCDPLTELMVRTISYSTGKPLNRKGMVCWPLSPLQTIPMYKSFCQGTMRPPSITKRGGVTPFWFSTPYFSAVADALSSGVITCILTDTNLVSRSISRRAVNKLIRVCTYCSGIESVGEINASISTWLFNWPSNSMEPSDKLLNCSAVASSLTKSWFRKYWVRAKAVTKVATTRTEKWESLFFPWGLPTQCRRPIKIEDR